MEIIPLFPHHQDIPQPHLQAESGAHAKDTPTEQLYSELLTAHRFFNERLFNGHLPDVVFSLRATARSNAYFAADRFGAIDDETQRRHEIALNPKVLRDRPLKHSLGTIAHEQAHLFCEVIGKPAKGRYHDKNWARVMEAIGLMPSDTGQPGGRKTGHRVSHYIVENGPFDCAADELIGTGFRLTYFDAWRDAPRSSGGRRTKYTCPRCGLAVLGPLVARLACIECPAELIAVSR